jgi:hypothetical protein
MTKKTFSKFDYGNILDDPISDTEDVEEHDQTSKLNQEETSEKITLAYNAIKEEARNMYYFCIMDDDVHVHQYMNDNIDIFSKYIRNSRSYIPSFTFRRWEKCHKDVLRRTYEHMKHFTISPEQFAWIIWKMSSPCSCNLIE